MFAILNSPPRLLNSFCERTSRMAILLYNIVTLTPATFCLFAWVLVVSALLASYIPARRAARIDPVIALGDE